MSHYHGDDTDYMADEYEMEDIDDDMDDEYHGREMEGSDSDADEFNSVWSLYNLEIFAFIYNFLYVMSSISAYWRFDFEMALYTE